MPAMTLTLILAMLLLGSSDVLAKKAGIQTSYRIRVMPDPATGLPRVEQQSTSMSMQRRNVKSLSVVVKQLQPRPEAWRVQARSEPLHLDNMKAYNWELEARAGGKKASVNVALYSHALRRVVAVKPTQLTSSWKRVSLRLVQPITSGTHEFQVHVGSSLGAFYFRELSLSSVDLDLSFLNNTDDRIQSVRQGTFWLSAADQYGSAVPVYGLNLTLQRHAFEWGTAIEPDVVKKKNPR